jgi:ABC-type uncharacterized transport system substrate-binding protein
MLQKACVRLCVAAWMVAICLPTASAHPHAWIDVKTTIILSNPGIVSAIREDWSFDRDYTNVLLRGPKGQRKPLTEFTQTAMHNLAPYSYFLELHAGGARLSLGQASDGDSKITNDSLEMHFTVSLARPVDISRSEMTLSVYDPTYYIDFEHVKSHPLSFEGPGADACVARITPAHPPAEALSQAKAMDRNAAINTSLGKMFAETVSIRCALAH